MKQPVIIIGMYHSGTGLLAEALAQAGIFMGHDVTKNSESGLFHAMNEWIFLQAGATWDNPYNLRFINTDFSHKITRALRRQLKGKHLKPFLDASRRSYHSFEKFNFDWGWADPLNTFTIEMWKGLFQDAKIIHIYRNPMDVAANLKMQNKLFKEAASGWIFKVIKRRKQEKRLTSQKLFELSLRTNTVDECFKLWEQYIRQAMRVQESSGFASYHLCFEDWVQNFKSESEKLFRFLGFTIPDGSLIEMEAKIKSEKCFSFLKDDELNEYYQSIKNQSLMTELNYHALQ